MGIIGSIIGAAMDVNKLVKQSKAQKDTTTQHVVVNGKYSIDVPSFLSPRSLSGTDASLYYGSRSLGISFMVIDESKEEFIQALQELQSRLPSIFEKDSSLLDHFATFVINKMFEIDKVEIGGYRSVQIDGLNALIMNVFQKRTFFKDAVYGSFAFIEGKDMLYQIDILSGGTSISKLADKIEQSIYSFREI